MAISFVAEAHTTYASRSSPTTVTKPTGTVDGDLIVMFFVNGRSFAAGGPPTLTPPTGWTELTGSPLFQDASGFNVNFHAYYRIASSEPASWDFTYSNSPSPPSTQGVAVTYRGVDTSTPLDATPTANHGTGTTTTATGLTTVTDNAVVVYAAHDWGDTANALTPPSGTTPTFTERLDRANVESSITYVAEGTKTPAGATGNKTQTNNSSGSGPWAAYLVALRPSSLVTVQQLPSTDEATNSWTNQAGSGTNIYQAIDETAADDSDYVQSALAATSGSYYETKLTSASDPALSTDHVLHYRYRASPAYASTNVTVSLRQGAGTQIATATNNSIGGAWTDANVTLTGGEADAITDYSDLRIRVAPTGAAASAQTPARVANTTLTASNLTSQGATTVTVDSTAAAAIFPGHYMIAAVAVDNSGASGARPGLTVTDSRSHTWTVTTGGLQDPGAASAGAACYIAYTKVTTAYQASDTITFTWTTGSPTAKSISVAAFAGIHQSSPVAVTETTANAGSTAFSLGITPNAANQLVFAVGAIEGPSGDTWTNDADTTNGSWTAITEVSTGNTGAGDMTLQAAFKAVSASGAQTWNSTITSRDWCANAIVFAPDSLGSRVQVSWANLTVPQASFSTINGTINSVFALTATEVGTNTVGGAINTPIALTATVVGTKTVSGAAADTITFTATAAGARTATGTADAPIALTATATGTRTVTGAAADTYTFTATAVGTRIVNGTAADTITLTATADGTKEVSGAADAPFTFDAPVAGARVVSGAADAPFTFSTTAAGGREVTGTTAETFTFTATADGTVIAEEVSGTADAPIVLTATATGTNTVSGSASDTITFAATASAVSTITGTADAPFTFTSDLTGTAIAEEVAGVAAAALTFTAAGTGTKEVSGAAPTALTFTAAGTGTVDHLGAAAAALSFTSIGTGTTVVNGSATDTITFTADSAGTVVQPGRGFITTALSFATNGDGTVSHTGTGEAPYAFTATADGTRTVPGQAAATIAFTATADGVQEQTGTASLTAVFDAPATGTKTVNGSASDAVSFLAPAAGTHTVLGASSDDLTFTADATGLKTVTGFALATFVFDAPASGTTEKSGTADAPFVFTANADGSLGIEQFFSYALFLEHIRATVQADTGRPAYLTFVDDRTVPVEPYTVIHAFGTTGATTRSYSGEAVGLSFYLQVDGIGRKYHDALWVLDRAVRSIRLMTCPPYVNDLLVKARSSAFEVGSEGLRAVGQRLAVNATRADL